MKKLIMAAMVLMLSSCYPAPTHMKQLRPVVFYSYPCTMMDNNVYYGEMVYIELGWRYDSCQRMWFPRQYWNRGYIYRGEPRFVQPLRRVPPQVRREEPRPQQRQEARPPDVRNRERQAEPRRPEVRQPQQPKQQQPQPRRRPS